MARGTARNGSSKNLVEATVMSGNRHMVVALVLQMTLDGGAALRAAVLDFTARRARGRLC